MPKNKQYSGTCFFCNQEFSKRGMGKHLQACKARKASMEKLDQKKKKVFYQLVAEDAYSHYYWLHLEMEGNTSLEKLDSYLRSIWLECCHHLSDFLEPGRGGSEIPMTKKISAVFSPGMYLTHIYDWGTSSETNIRCTGIREGAAMTRHPVLLMARNNMPEHICVECKKSASFFCWDCIADFGAWEPLCETCVKDHECFEDRQPGDIINSPRMGMCGYDGPAKPPY
jgi:hypothetical protein